jgi:nucleoid DNA-binding protein
MDVVKYIGLYLLKNRHVNIHGLGNLELRIIPAQYDGESLIPASNEIELFSSGSIDDNLANFIANNEQLSISKALNTLREFSLQAKSDLQEGKEIIIPAVGKFKEVNGKTVFFMNPAFRFIPVKIQTSKTGKTLMADPILVGRNYQTSRPVRTPPTSNQDPFTQQNFHLEQTNYHQTPIPPDAFYEQPRQSSINWTRVIIALVILLLFVFGVYFLISLMSGNDQNRKKIILPSQVAKQSIDTAAIDTLPQDTSITAMNKTPEGKGLTFDVRMFAFSNITNARTKMKELQDKGYSQTFLDQTPDSSFTFVLIPIESISPADTAYLMDSLRKLNILHPQKVGIYRYH